MTHMMIRTVKYLLTNASQPRVGGTEDFEKEEVQGGWSHSRLKSWSSENYYIFLTDVDIGQTETMFGEGGMLHGNFILASVKI